MLLDTSNCRALWWQKGHMSSTQKGTTQVLSLALLTFEYLHILETNNNPETSGPSSLLHFVTTTQEGTEICREPDAI